jgi:hypothetical protein
MIRWTSTTPAPLPQRWQSRAEILKAHLDSLTPDELRRVRPDYYWLRFGYEAWKREHARKANFNPNQPRVPADNSDGGQWTNEGGGVGRARFADASGASTSPVMSDATPDPIRVGAQYAQASTRVAIDYSRALTGISTIDNTTKALSQTLARTMETMDFIPEWTPQQYGTAVHVAFGTTVRFLGLPGIGFNDVEHSFIDSRSADYYGQPGSIRTDVVLRNEVGDVIAIYDLKTGGATLTPARVQELREKTGVGPSIPIIELKAGRGPTLKSLSGPRRSIGVVTARLWDLSHHRDNSGLAAGR